MKKEQFLRFKSDLKNDIEANKLVDKFNKKWSNLGYASEEEYNKDYTEAKEKSYAIDAKITKLVSKWGNKYNIINSALHSTHLAYYCAKHQLSEEEAKVYVNEQFNKMKESNRMSYPSYGSSDYLFKRVKEILDSYETLVCSD